MQNKIKVSLGNLVLSLSDAMDLAHPALIRHQQKVAYAVWQMATVAGLSDERIETLFFAALLHDIGAFSLEEKIALADSRAKYVDLHCIRGELVLENIPMLDKLSKIIRFHHTEWQKWEKPIDTSIVLESQIVFLADYLERLVNRDVYILHQHNEIKSKIRLLSGTLFHQRVVDIFLEASANENFWLNLTSPRLYPILLRDGPFGKKTAGIPDLFQISKLFRNIIDFRSRFTSTHSSGVAASASLLAKQMDFTPDDMKLMEIAGNLHDIGKLAIPNRILNKPGRLTKKEMAVMKAHTYHTYSVIKTIGGLDKVADWAAYHHEKLDGSGYPFTLKAGALSIGARIMMVADIMTALIEDRPYRMGMSGESAIQILQKFSDKNLLDLDIVNLFIDNYESIISDVLKTQAEASEFYNSQFASLGSYAKL